MRASTVGIIKATAPILEHSAIDITTRFYTILLGEHPELQPLFNRSHQGSGQQAHALANAIVAFATHIETPAVLDGALRRIAHKHASLGVTPKQYDIVGHCLLRSIHEILGDAAAVEILDAWGEAYEYLSTLLIEMEEEIYRHNESKRGGWRGTRRFKVVRTEQESSTIRSFYLAPVDRSPLMPFEAGQYLTVLLSIDGQAVRRNYSISSAPGRPYYRITIKRESEGTVSRYFHDEVQLDHELDILPPCGDFVLEDSDKPLVLISGGVGITPTISMLDAAIASGRRIIFLHATRNGEEHAFRKHVQALAEQHPQLCYAFVYEQPDGDDVPQYIGLVDRTFLSRHLDPARADMDVYFVGPKPFMETVFHHVQHIGVPDQQVHFEFFGPHQELAASIPEDTPSSSPRILMRDLPGPDFDGRRPRVEEAPGPGTW